MHPSPKEMSIDEFLLLNTRRNFQSALIKDASVKNVHLCSHAKCFPLLKCLYWFHIAFLLLFMLKAQCESKPICTYELIHSSYTLLCIPCFPKALKHCNPVLLYFSESAFINAAYSLHFTINMPRTFPPLHISPSFL